MKTVLIISSLFLLFACTNQEVDKHQHIKKTQSIKGLNCINTKILTV